MGLRLAALAWGFAEATLFFIVPDVLLSFVALTRRRRAAIACLFVVVGSLAGGSVMYVWGQRDPAGAMRALERTPAVGKAMLNRVEQDLREHGAAAMFAGAFSGKPYKTYAVLAGKVGVPLPVFLAVSIPARLARFVLVVWLVGWISAAWSRRLPESGKVPALVAFWVCFYAAFFSLMPA